MAETVAVKCPICEGRLECSCSSDLTQELKEHMVGEHGMKLADVPESEEMQDRWTNIRSSSGEDEGDKLAKDIGSMGKGATRETRISDNPGGTTDRGGGIGGGVYEKERTLERERSMGKNAPGEKELEAGSQEVVRGGADELREGQGSKVGSRPTAGGGIGEGLKVSEKERSFEVGLSSDQGGMGKFEHSVESSSSQSSRSEECCVGCPFCGEEVKGSSEEDLSKNLREHTERSHSDDPQVLQEMERVREEWKKERVKTR